MNFLAWALALSTLVILLMKAVSFQQATVCRQQAWLEASVLKTRSLLSETSEHEQLVNKNCRLLVRRTKRKVAWQRFPSWQQHEFNLSLEGKL